MREISMDTDTAGQPGQPVGRPTSQRLTPFIDNQPGWFAATRILLVVLLSAYLVPRVIRAQTQPDSLLTNRYAILRVAHLNFDCYADTIIGRRDRFRTYLPVQIRWGRDPGIDSALRRGDEFVDACHDGVRWSRKVAATLIVWPTWEQRRVSFALQRVNRDSLPDLIIYLRGKVTRGRETVDTLRPIIIFGQHGLDTVSTIDLGRIGRFQTGPFIAMEFRPAQDLRDPGRRDLAGGLSYRFPTLDVTVGRPDTTDDRRGQSTASTPTGTVRIFPNPSAISTQVELATLPEGRYRVEIVAVTGRIELRTEISIETGQSVLQRLDVGRLPNGYYALRVLGPHGPIGVYPITITR